MNEKNFFYFASDADTASRMLTTHQESIAPKRQAAIDELYLEAGGAIAHTESSPWGGVSHIDYLVFPGSHAITKEKHIKFLERRKHEGKTVAIVTGRGNFKDGKAFNARIRATNEKIKDLPIFTDWVVNHLDAQRACLGAPNPHGSGVSMISSQAGMVTSGEGERLLLLRIPKRIERVGDSEAKEEPFPTPEGFRELSYGQFYDMANAS
jgi:hypothetical protein